MDLDRRTARCRTGRRSLHGGAGSSAQPLATNRTRLILLGTAGGPRPRKKRSGSAQAIVSGGKIVRHRLRLRRRPAAGARRTAAADSCATFSSRTITPIITSTSGRCFSSPGSPASYDPVDCWGPPPTKRMVGDYLRYQSYDIALRISDEGRMPFAPLIHAHDLVGGGPGPARRAGAGHRGESAASAASAGARLSL